MDEPILTKKVGTAEINVYEDLTDINDTLLMYSDTLIASYKDEENSIDIAFVTRGDVKVCFDGDWYLYPDDYPDELVQMIKDGTIRDGGIGSYAYVDFNNWINYEEYDKDGDLICDDVIDIEGYNPEQIAEYIEDLAKELINERENEDKDER